VTVRDSKTRRPRVVPLVQRARVPLLAWIRTRAARPHPRTLHAAFERGRAHYGRFYTKTEAEKMAALLLREFRNGIYIAQTGLHAYKESK
jgi:hypothetical protein